MSVPSWGFSLSGERRSGSLQMHSLGGNKSLGRGGPGEPNTTLRLGKTPLRAGRYVCPCVSSGHGGARTFVGEMWVLPRWSQARPEPYLKYWMPTISHQARARSTARPSGSVHWREAVSVSPGHSALLPTLQHPGVLATPLAERLRKATSAGLSDWPGCAESLQDHCRSVRAVTRASPPSLPALDAGLSYSRV